MDEADWDARYAGRELAWTGEANVFVVKEVAGLVPGRALDLACGEGRNAVWLARRGWSVTAVDWSAVGLAKARELGAGLDVAWVRADVLAWPAPQAAFDLVLVAYIHLPAADRADLLARAAAAVAPGGSLVLVAHDLANHAGGVGGPKDAGVLWTPEEVRVEGFTVTRSEVAPRHTTSRGETGTALDTVVHLVRAG